MQLKFIKPFRSITSADITTVGGKTASLGQMMNVLATQEIEIPDGFAITVEAYWHFVNHNNLISHIEMLMAQLADCHDLALLKKVGQEIRNLFLNAVLSVDLADEIRFAYTQLCKEYKQKKLKVVVRSSATAEDLADASFAGQHESYLHVVGQEDLLDACKKCFASLFTDRAIAYRYGKNFDYKKLALSIAVQKLVRADKAVSGVGFSLDTESGFKDVVVINATYGLGESLVKGAVVPDEYVIFKPTLNKGYASIIKQRKGEKKVKSILGQKGIQQSAVSKKEQHLFCLTTQEVLTIARAICTIENHYSQLKGAWCPMDVEWAKDGSDNTLYIVQARPETIHASQSHAGFEFNQYRLHEQTSAPLVTGQSIGKKIVSGIAKVVDNINDCSIEPGDIIITAMTDPDWVPALKKASGIITQLGGRTCHAAIVSRELQIPALVGAGQSLEKIKNGMAITLDCSQGLTGYVYQGALSFEETTITLDAIPGISTDIMLNLADPARAFSLSALPVAGVGLARIEFIISNTLKVHPLALIYPELVTDKKTRMAIDTITQDYIDKKEFFIEGLAQGVATIASAFYPRPVIVRFSDFKTNEYRNLIGGTYFEPHEENPMIGLRGASRYYHEQYKHAFALECAAIKKVREHMGLANVKVMVPFVRTLDEGKRVIQEIENNGLSRASGLEIIMMCEIPANALLIDEFLQDFDGISIGSNDLTQLALGIDRDSASLASLFDERDPAVKKLIAMAIEGAQRAGKYHGICGQAPSDYPEFADYLITLGIQSISLNPDSVIPFLLRTQKIS